MGKTISPSTNRSIESLASTAQNTRDDRALDRNHLRIHVQQCDGGYAEPYWLGGRDLSTPYAAAAIGLLNVSALGGSP
jgi:hypothetical protein